MGLELLECCCVTCGDVVPRNLVLWKDDVAKDIGILLLEWRPIAAVFAILTGKARSTEDQVIDCPRCVVFLDKKTL